MTKYNFDIDNNLINTNINRLTNQIWKLIPMRENEEDWLSQLNTVIIELTGLGQIFNDSQYLILLSKLEGLKNIMDYLIHSEMICLIDGKLVRMNPQNIYDIL